MYDVRDFPLSDMVRLDAALRADAQGATSMEQVAQRVVTRLRDQLVDKETGTPSCVLARLFVMVPLGRLEPDLRAVALAALGPEAARTPGIEAVQCLALLATVGDERDWSSRHLSRAHGVIPLPDESAVHRSPMIAELVRQLGVDVGALASGTTTGLFVGRPGGSLDVFHVEDATGSPFVPAQEDFVVPYGVRSVLGFGGILPDGVLYAVICFSRTRIPRNTAEKFSTVASSVGLAMLPHAGSRIFDSENQRAGGSEPALDAWRADAVSALLMAHEASVLEQSVQLEAALGGLEDRAVELHRTRAAIGRSEALKSAMLASALDAVVSIDAAGSVIEWNPAAEQTFGHSRDEALGQPMVDLIVPEHHRRAHQLGLARYLRTEDPVILGRRIEIEGLHADGHVFPVELTVSRAPVDGPPVFTAFVRDISLARQAAEHREQLLESERRARKAAEQSARQLRRLYEVGAALGDAVSADGVARVTLATVMREIGASTGAVWILDGKSSALQPAFAVGASIGLLSRGPLELTAPLPVATACREGVPVWVTSRADGRAQFPHWPAEESEARSFAVLPLRTEQRATGSLVVGFDDERDIPADERTFLLSVAGQCAQALDRARLRDLEAAAAARLAFLADAGRALGTSLDYSTTLQQVTELSLTVLGEMCVIHLLDPSSHSLEQVAWAHADPGRAEVLDRLQGYQPPAGSPLETVLRTAEPLVLSGFTDEALRAATTTREEYELAVALTLGATVVVPLATHGTTIGTIAFGRTPGHPPYDDHAVALAEALAERAAAAIDNARAHESRTEIALTLQRSLLPLDLQTPAGLELGFRYLPGSIDTEVGGDWFDLIPLSVGRSAIVIGDVMGRGVHAAAVMGQLRAAVRAYASIDLAPEPLMTELDRLVQGLGDGGLVTCVYGVIDALTGELTLCNAGHLPPIVTSPDGARTLDLPTGAPLGVGGVRFETSSESLGPESVLVLFTDGLVESRDREVSSGIATVTDVLSRPYDDLDSLCAHVLRTMVGEAGHDDDAAIIAVGRSEHGEGARAARLAVRGDAGSVSRARSRLQETLAAWGIGATAETCVLLGGELLANATRHAGTEIELRVGLAAGTLRVEVWDQGTGLPRRRAPQLEDESGRGLVLLETLAERWGVSRLPDGGKSVWFEVPASHRG